MKDLPTPRHWFPGSPICLLLVVSCQIAVSQMSEDAIILTLRSQQGIRLDSALADRIDSGLVASRLLNDSLNDIHAFPDYIPTELLVKTASPWSAAWRRGEIITGEHFIDSLAGEFELVTVSYSFADWFLLTFAHPLQMENLGAVYKKQSDVIYAEPNASVGDGNRIEFFDKNGIMHFSFSLGWDDCPAGCLFRFYWYIVVTRSVTGLQASLEETWFRDLTVARVTRWNNPPRYAMTFFPTVDSIFAMAIHHPLWWYRRHAIEGTWRFFVWSSPWVGEDLNARWSELHSGLLSRRSEVDAMLTLAGSDPDPDVRASADTARARIPVLVGPPGEPRQFALLQNYPNPFNASTKIQFTNPVGTYGRTSLRVYDLLGREVATLVNEVMQPGEYQRTFDGTALASGLYVYRLQSGAFVESKKLLLLR